MTKDLELKRYLRTKKRVMRYIKGNVKRGTPQKNNATALAEQANIDYRQSLRILGSFKKSKRIDFINGIAYLD